MSETAQAIAISVQRGQGSATPLAVTRRAIDTPLRHVRRPPLTLYGMLLLCAGAFAYVLGVLLVFPRYLAGLNAWLMPLDENLVWYSGIPVLSGLALMLADLAFFFDSKRKVGELRWDDVRHSEIVVALTAYNDEASIGPVVTDFLAHPRVGTVLVVSNNSTDRTCECARGAGAIVYDESRAGYGRCVYRCLQEALRSTAADLIVLCEGDRTFRAQDLDKLIAYAPHADIVNGTRTVERLREHRTQLTTFMYYGNLFVGKLLEAKHLGLSTITDVGTTYKLCRRESLERLLPCLDPSVNLEFNAHFLDTALRLGLILVECPITFHRRVGTSKGGNRSNVRALIVGWRMMRGIVLGWNRLPR